jgi:hypothetical protein
MFDPTTFADPSKEPVLFVFKPPLHYNWHRFYDPMVGRYVSADPIGLGGGDANLYRYVHHDPGNQADFNGLDPGDVFLTQHLAAQDALNYTSFLQLMPVLGGWQFEWGGWIYQENNGYTYTFPMTAFDPDHIPSEFIEWLRESIKRRQKKPCAFYHSHRPNEWFTKPSSYFSYGDVRWSMQNRMQVYMTNGLGNYVFTPSGSLSAWANFVLQKDPTALGQGAWFYAWRNSLSWISVPREPNIFGVRSKEYGW